jgi:hypothetical protein
MIIYNTYVYIVYAVVYVIYGVWLVPNMMILAFNWCASTLVIMYIVSLYIYLYTYIPDSSAFASFQTRCKRHL